MDTVVSTPVEPELNLLTTWGQADDAPRRRKAAIATFIFHIAAIGTLFLLPESFFESKQTPEPERHITPIYEPLTRLTQKAPNTTKATKEFNAEEQGVRGHVTMPTPPAPPPAKRTERASAAPAPEPVKKAVIPQVAPSKPQTSPPVPEPPKVDAPTGSAPKVELPQLGTIPQPQIQPQEQPKLALQNLSQGPPPVLPPDQRKIALPDTSLSGAIQRSIQEATPPHPPTPPPGDTQAMQLPQLLSDAQGVDFTSYLRQILQTVRRNWQSIIPESAKLGTRAKVSIVLSIERNGQLGKVVLYQASGVDSLDRAGVSAISMSQPFPPFPNDFKGNEIRVQFNFAYNAPRQ